MHNGKRIVIIGSSFAGFTAAIELKNKLKDQHQISVLSKTDEFLFMPSLIWVPFGLRKRQDISFSVAPILERRGIEFKQATVTRIDLERRELHSDLGTDSYDYLVIATGPKLNYEAVPGLGPHGGYTQSIFSWQDAESARVTFEEFVKNPGPVVIGAVQGASCFGAAYEFLFNMAYQLKKRGLQAQAPLTYVTAEPYLAHFGIGGFGNGTRMTEFFFKREHISAVTDVAVKEIRPGEVHLSDNRILPFSYAMLAPSFLGIDAVRACTDIVDAGGFVRINPSYQTEKYPEVFAAGVAVSMPRPDQTKIPCGVPKTGYLSEEMAKVVVHNIIASIHGEPLVALPPASIDAKCVLDAGNTGIIMTADHFLEPREHAWLIPGPEAHWAKLAFEKYFLATHRHGHV